MGQSPLAEGSGDGCPPKLSLISGLGGQPPPEVESDIRARTNELTERFANGAFIRKNNPSTIAKRARLPREDPTGQSPLAGGSGDGCPPKLSLISGLGGRLSPEVKSDIPGSGTAVPRS